MGNAGAKYLLVITVLLCLIVLVMAAFDEVPVSQEVPVGTEAVFRCRHSTADNIRWIVNGTFVGRNPPHDITPGTTRDEEGNLVDTLTIVARREYNGTTIECVAEFDDETPDETSVTPALLQVQDIPSSGSTTMPSTTLPMTTSQQADINPTDNTGGEFITSPLSVNVTVGNETMFHCEHSNADSYSWLINGTALARQSHLQSTFRDGPSGSVRTLTVTALSQYNSTRIECVAFFLNDQPSERTPPALLRIQGPLDAVTSLTKINTIISWEPPFSLDLTNIDPDIVYCVDVYNITCGGRDLVSSDCSMTDTNYTSLSDGYLYEYIVTPRSNVEGAVNGTVAHLRDMLPTFRINSSHLSLGDQPNKTNYRILLNYSSDQLSLPSSFTLSLKASDGMDDLDPIVIQNHTKKESNMVELSVTDLEYRRLWDCTIFVLGCDEHIILKDAILSTHDFYHISISSPSAGVVGVTGRFVEGSPATGVLGIVSGDSGVTYHISSRNGSGIHEVTISGLAGGEYTVSVFVVEENGLPFERAAMLPKRQHVETNTVHVKAPSSSIEYSLESTSTGVCVNCNFLDTDASECIAVVYHNLTNIESSHKFTRSGDTASGCIEGVNLEDYQVGVIGGRRLDSGPAHSSNLTVIIVALITTVTLLAVIVIVLFIIVKVYYGKYRNHTIPGDTYKMQNYYTTHTSAPTKNPCTPEVVQSVENISTDATQASTASSESRTEDGITPLYSTVEVKPKPSSLGDASQTSTSVADSAKQSGISPLYSQVDVKPQLVSVPPVVDHVLYSEVTKTQGADDRLYAMVNPKGSARDSYPDDMTKVVYSEIRPHGVEQRSHTKSIEKIPTVPPPPPFTTDAVVDALLPVASKWQAIGEAFSLSEKRLDDIETTERDEQCLQEMIEAYMLRRDLNHTWDEIVNVLKKIKEDSLAEEIFKSHVAPYVLTLPNQPLLSESGTYTHGLKSLPPVRKVCTDGGSLDTSSPVLSGQQTEPPTSLSIKGEVKPDKEESLPTCTPESHCGDVVLEMPPYNGNEGFNSYHSHCTWPKRVAIDGDSTDVENREDEIISSESKGEAPCDAQEAHCESGESSKGQVVTDSDSGVSEDQNYSLPSERDDMPSPRTDDYKSDFNLPSSSDEIQCGKSDHGGVSVASSSQVNGSLVTLKRAGTHVDNENYFAPLRNHCPSERKKLPTCAEQSTLQL